MPLHNLIDPIREAKTTWNKTIKTELKKNDIQIYIRTWTWVIYLKEHYVSSTESKIFLLEPFIEMYQICS